MSSSTNKSSSSADALPDLAIKDYPSTRNPISKAGLASLAELGLDEAAMRTILGQSLSEFSSHHGRNPTYNEISLGLMHARMEQAS
jgi:hypothetical protein